MRQDENHGPEELHWTPEMVARFWAHESARVENYFAYQVGMAVVRHMAPHLAKARRIVDYGAGPGYLVDDLLASGHQCGAVEFGASAVRALQAKFAGRRGFLGAWEVNEARALPDQFDLAVLMEVVEHLYDDQLQACLANIRAMLSPGGLLIVTTPNAEDLSTSMVMNPETGRIFHRWQHVRSWTKDSLPKALTEHGFAAIACEATDFGFSPAAMRRIHPMPLRLLRAGAKRGLALMDRSRRLPHLYAVARVA